MATELRKVFGDLKKRFRAGAVATRTTFYFSLGETEHEKWNLTVSPKDCAVRQGRIEDADCVIKTSADLFSRIVTGEHRPGIGDFLSGRLKSNDPDKLRILEKAFGIGR